nr:MAG TPA: hypothetical protein [Caudoviricetes sp.]
MNRKLRRYLVANSIRFQSEKLWGECDSDKENSWFG